MGFTEYLIEEAITFNLEENKPLTECIFRRESENFCKYYKYLRENQHKFDLSEADKLLLKTDIGETTVFGDKEVFLDLPFVSEKSEMEDNPCWDGYTMVGTKMKNGKEVPNCVPNDSLDEADYKGKDVELDKPKRSNEKGDKKYYVYTKNDKGNVIKVSFGDVKGGLSAKINDEAARKSFAARHQCDKKNDKTKPGYWACRLPWYAKELGLSGGGKFWW